LPNALVRQSTDLAGQKAQLQRLLFARVYRHPIVLDQRARAGAALEEMFDRLVAHPAELPAKFSAIALKDGLPRAVGDYLAGMTDRYALEEHEQMTSGAVHLRG
jgi:dGTPase